MALLPDISPKGIDALKRSILYPALTSHFAIAINPQKPVRDFISSKTSGKITPQKIDDLVILCADASLPGSSLFTHEVTNDYTGVTEKMVYRRQYDDRASFMFYVDRNYEIIQLFEAWIAYIVGEDNNRDLLEKNVTYRMKYRDDYAGDIAISKFERDIGSAINTQTQQPQLTGTRLNYTFVRAFPVSIDSMPVSYEGSTVMKCNVNFAYTRYVVEKTT